MKKLIILVAVAVMSCQSQSKVLDSWIGHTKNELIVSSGPPQRTAPDGAGGEVLIYAKQYMSQGSSFTTSNEVTRSSPSNVYWKYTMFYADAKGIIYHWRVSTEYVPPTQVEVTVYRGNN